MKDHHHAVFGLLVVATGTILSIFTDRSFVPVAGMVMMTAGWITSVIIMQRTIAQQNADVLKSRMAEVQSQVESVQELIDSLLPSVFKDWITSDPILASTFEKNVKSGSAIVVATPTFRNDYPTVDSTGFAANVSENLARGVKYRYFSTKAAVEKHAPLLITHHSKTVKLKPGDIKFYIVDAPLVTEMVLYPLDPPVGFTIITIERERGPAQEPEKKEFNARMVRSADLERFESYVRHMLKSPFCRVSTSDESGGRTLDAAVTEEELREFGRLTNIGVQSDR